MASFEKLKSNWNQTRFICIMWEPSYVHTVRGHVPRSKVIWGQVVRWAENVKMVSFEKLTWTKLGVLIQYGNLHMFMWSRLHIMIIGQPRSTCKMTWKCKFWLIFIFEDQLELPNRCGGQMWTCIIHKPGRQVTLTRFLPKEWIFIQNVYKQRPLFHQKTYNWKTKAIIFKS